MAILCTEELAAGIQFVVDGRGNVTSVILLPDAWQRLIARLEDAEDRELFPATHSAPPLGKDGAINYGCHTAGPVTPDGPYLGHRGVILWQQRGFRHNRFHVDYSQWVPRFVHPRMRVDGRNVATAEAMMSPELAGLVSYQEPLLGVRYPLWEHPALTPSSTSRPASTSRHETSFPLDSSDTASSFDPFADLRRNAPWGR